jgi:hypothetical protein
MCEVSALILNAEAGLPTATEGGVAADTRQELKAHSQVGQFLSSRVRQCLILGHPFSYRRGLLQGKGEVFRIGLTELLASPPGLHDSIVGVCFRPQQKVTQLMRGSQP